MKKIVKAVIAFTLTCALSTFLFSGIEKINEGLYIGKKGDIYFALERVTPETIDFWKEYADHQYNLAQKLEEKTNQEFEIESKKYILAQKKYAEEYSERKKLHDKASQKEVKKLKTKYNDLFFHSR